MAEKSLPRTNFADGITTIGEKVGTKNSYRFSKNLNIFEDPSYITLAKAPSKVSGSTVDALPTWMTDGSPWNTNRYFYLENGKIAQETDADVWSILRTVSGSTGEGMVVFNRGLYYAQGTEMGRYYPLDDSPSFDDAFNDWWIANQLQTTGGGTGTTDYSTTTSINEGATHKQTFTVEHDPIKSITIDIDVVGTGDWTVTVHNENNDTICSSTIANASVTTGDNVFTMSSVGRSKIGESYHFHVTTTVADGGVDTSTNNDLEAAEFTVQYATLIDADFHPMVEFLNGFAFGNGNYIGFFDGANFEPNQIELAPGFQVRSLAKKGEFIVAACWRGVSFDEAEESRLYFWDGIQPTFNYHEDLKIGAPNALHNHKGRLIGVFGNRGSVYEYQGEEKFVELVDEVPKLARNKKVEVYPSGISTYEERVVISYAASTDDGTGVEQGVYELGSQTDALNEAFNFPYTISTGTTQGTSLKIGAIKGFGKELYIGWRDDDEYGVDKVSPSSVAASSGVFEDRIMDGGDTDSNKQAVKVIITSEALASGESITPKYKLDRGSFTDGSAMNTTGETKAEVFINTVCREFEWGFTLASSNGTFPKVTGVIPVYNNLDTEGK